MKLTPAGRRRLRPRAIARVERADRFGGKRGAGGVWRVCSRPSSPLGFGTKVCVQVIYPPEYQNSIGAIRAIPVRTQSGGIVHVGDLATMQYNPQPPLISRTNRQTVVHVSANNAAGTPLLSVVQNRFLAKLASLHLPSGVEVRPQAGGNQRNLADTVGGVGAALGLSFVLVYLLMLALYDSYRLPFIIMFAIPVASVVGALG